MYHFDERCKLALRSLVNFIVPLFTMFPICISSVSNTDLIRIELDQCVWNLGPDPNLDLDPDSPKWSPKIGKESLLYLDLAKPGSESGFRESGWETPLISFNRCLLYYSWPPMEVFTTKNNTTVLVYQVAKFYLLPIFLGHFWLRTYAYAYFFFLKHRGKLQHYSETSLVTRNPWCRCWRLWWRSSMLESLLHSESSSHIAFTRWSARSRAHSVVCSRAHSFCT